MLVWLEKIYNTMVKGKSWGGGGSKNNRMYRIAMKQNYPWAPLTFMFTRTDGLWCPFFSVERRWECCCIRYSIVYRDTIDSWTDNNNWQPTTLPSYLYYFTYPRVTYHLQNDIKPKRGKKAIIPTSSHFSTPPKKKKTRVLLASLMYVRHVPELFVE